MSTQPDKIILELTISDKEATKRIAQNNKDVKALQEENKKLAKSYEENAEAIAENNEKIKSLNRESSVYSMMVQKQTQYNKANTGSLTEMRAKLSLLNREYAELSQEQRENVQVGGKMRAEIKGLSDELKRLESALGDDTRKVGSYKQAIMEAIAESGKFGGSITGIGAALKANPLGLLITAVTTLFSLFSQNAGFADGFKDTFGFIGRLVTVITNRITKFGDSINEVGDTITEALNNPKQIIIDLGNLIKTNLENRFKSFGVILEGFRKGSLKGVFNGFVQLGTGVDNVTGRLTNGAKAVRVYSKDLYDQAKALNDIDVARRKLERAEILNISTSKALMAQQEQLKNIRDNEFNSIEQRISANQKAAKLEQDRINNELKFAQQSLGLAEKEIALLGEKNVGNDKLREREEARLRVADLQEESLERQNEYITNTFQLEKEREEFYQARTLKRLEDEKAAIELRLLEVEKGGEAELAELVRLRQKERDIELSNAELTQTQRALIIAKAERDIYALRRDYFLKGLDLEPIDTGEADKRRREAEKARLEEVKAEEKKFNDQLLAENTWIGKSIEQRADKYAKDQDQRAVDKEQAQKAADEEIRIQEAKYDAIMSITDGLSALSGLLAKNSAQAADFEKGIALFQIGIDTAKAISAVTAKNASTSLTPVDFAIRVAASIGIVLTNIAKAAQLLKGKAPDAPQFERASNRAAGGGDFLTTGPTMLLVGDNPGGIERVTVKPISGKGITSISPDSGLIRMAGGGTLTADGGMVTRAAAAPVLQGNGVTAEQVMEMIQNTPVIVHVADINQAAGRVAKTVTESNI